MLTNRGKRIELFIDYLHAKYPELNILKLQDNLGIRWKLYNRYIDDEIRKYMISYPCQQFYDFRIGDDYQYVYINKMIRQATEKVTWEITTDEEPYNKYIRYSPNCWMIVKEESKEPMSISDYWDLEREFQEIMADKRRISLDDYKDGF